MEKVILAIKLVYQEWGFRLLTIILFLGTFTFYLFLLPVSFTGGKIGLVSLKFLNPVLIFFSFSLALFFSLSLTFIIYSLRSGLKAKGRPQSIIAMIFALLPGFLCCTPLIPSLLVILGASTPLIFGLTGPIQGFFASYSLYFYIFSLILVVWAFYLSAKNLVGICHLKS